MISFLYTTTFSFLQEIPLPSFPTEVQLLLLHSSLFQANRDFYIQEK